MTEQWLFDALRARIASQLPALASRASARVCAVGPMMTTDLASQLGVPVETLLACLVPDIARDLETFWAQGAEGPIRAVRQRRTDVQR